MEHSAERSFGGLSLRRVAQHAGVVPTAFYRHFASMDELGIELVRRSFGSLRPLLKAVRVSPAETDWVIGSSIAILIAHTEGNTEAVRFIARERFGGVASVRAEIASELDGFVAELDADIVAFPGGHLLGDDVRRTLAELIVEVMLQTAAQLTEVDENRPSVSEITERTTAQVALLISGANASAISPASTS